MENYIKECEEFREMRNRKKLAMEYRKSVNRRKINIDWQSENCTMYVLAGALLLALATMIF